jgi:hypothetical protein
MTGNKTSGMGRRSLERMGALLLTAALMGCTGASSGTGTGPGAVVSAQPDALVFSTVQGQASSGQYVTLRNPSADPVTVTSLSVPGSEFELVNPPALPVTLAPGGSLAVDVRLKSSGSVGVLRSTLQSQGGVASVALAGLRAVGLEGSNEPALGQIVDALGYGLAVGWTGLTTDVHGGLTGDQISAPRFVKAGAGPVTLTPVARYSPDGTIPSGYYTVAGSGQQRTTTETLVAGSYQALNPAVTGTQTFDPGSEAFGIFIDPRAMKTPYPLTYTQDSLNTDPSAHSVRTYPLRDRQGVVVAGAFVLCFEPGTNGDYQDAVFVLRNVKPAP